MYNIKRYISNYLINKPAFNNIECFINNSFRTKSTGKYAKRAFAIGNTQL